MFSCEFCEISKNSFFYRTLLVAAYEFCARFLASICLSKVNNGSSEEKKEKCFPVNIAKFRRTPFSQNTSGRLLLKILTIKGTLTHFRPYTLSTTHENIREKRNFRCFQEVYKENIDLKWVNSTIRKWDAAFDTKTRFTWYCRLFRNIEMYQRSVLLNLTV